MALSESLCAFAGTSRVVQVVSATTGDTLHTLPVNGTVHSVSLCGNLLAIGCEESLVTVHNIDTGKEVLALPSVAGDVHDVIVMDDILCFASGPACWMYGNGGDGFSWREQPDYYVAAYLIHPLVERCQLVERCLEPMLIAHPEIVNCKHPKTGETFLQYAVKTTTHPHVMRLLLEGNFETKIGLLRDNFDRTALHVALELGRRSWVKLIVSGIINGRVLNLPSALLPVVECFPALARAHPKQFIRLVCDMPLVRQHEDCSPNYADSPHTMETMGSHDARLFIQWSSPRGWAVAAIASLRCSSSAAASRARPRSTSGGATTAANRRSSRRRSRHHHQRALGLRLDVGDAAHRRPAGGADGAAESLVWQGRARSGFNTTMRRPSLTRSSRREGSAGGGGARARPTTTSPSRTCRCRRRARPSATRRSLGGDATPRHTRTAHDRIGRRVAARLPPLERDRGVAPPRSTSAGGAEGSSRGARWARR